MAPSPSRFRQIVTDPQFVSLFLVLGFLVALFFFFGFELTPFFIALVLAYLLEGAVRELTRRGMRRGYAVLAVFLLYLVIYVAVLVGPLQWIMERAVVLVQALPSDPNELVRQLAALPDLPFSQAFGLRKDELASFLFEQTNQWFDVVVANSFQWVTRITSWIVYLFLVPILVLFFLKDKESLIKGMLRCLPRDRELVNQIWLELGPKMANYIRGKLWEIVIVAVVTGLALALLGFEYPAVMGLISGISVLVPFVGAIGVAVPVAVLGYLQWGAGLQLGWLMIVYTVIQLLDGYVLVPLMFSEAVKLHPVAILLAVFIFGSLWGVLGIFFAIPLATLAKALLNTILEHRERVAE
ncbi:MAG: AI-2E family transporter [SAR324 cluster bacterium]|nr:AI-2E family transporter [SAR324 cluster bacterium]